MSKASIIGGVIAAWVVAVCAMIVGHLEMSYAQAELELDGCLASDLDICRIEQDGLDYWVYGWSSEWDNEVISEGE